MGNAGSVKAWEMTPGLLASRPLVSLAPRRLHQTVTQLRDESRRGSLANPPRRQRRVVLLPCADPTFLGQRSRYRLVATFSPSSRPGAAMSIAILLPRSSACSPPSSISAASRWSPCAAVPVVSTRQIPTGNRRSASCDPSAASSTPSTDPAPGFALDYPDYELIFCVASDGDPAIPGIRRLMAANPAVPARLLIGDDRISINPKLNNLGEGLGRGEA